MIKAKFNHWVGFALLIALTSFFFYKSVFSDSSLDTLLETIEQTQSLQVQLHRDLLRYRSNQIQGYDSLNETLATLEENTKTLISSSENNLRTGNIQISNLERLVGNESLLAEDFKTHHSILKNSLFYIYNKSSNIYSEHPDPNLENDSRITAELITLLLQYIESSKNTNINKRICYDRMDLIFRTTNSRIA